MGVTTVDVTREDALRYISQCLFDCSDDELCSILYEIYGAERLNNYWMVANYDNSERTINNPYGNNEEW